MLDFRYVVYIKGEHVHSGMSIKGVIFSIRQDTIIREQIKKDYGIEFEELSSRWIPGHWEFSNITDDRDVTLCITRTDYYHK